MERRIAQRIAALLTTFALAATLATVTTAVPADAVTFWLGNCSVSAGNGYYSYYWAATDSTDSDCTKVGAGFHSGSIVYDGTYPYNADKVSVSEPSGTVSVHVLFNPYTSAQRVISYTW